MNDNIVSRRGVVGFVLSNEQYPITKLVEFGKAAAETGFETVWASDHFHPWQDNQGHSSLAWITLAAVGQHTNLGFGTGVTCPTYRYQPAIVAQAFASLGILYPGRVFLGVGTGEALNELPSGGGWGEYEERAERLIEAVHIIRELWTGKSVTFKGKYYELNKARLYDVPEQPVPIYIAAAGKNSLELAGEYGDGLITHPPVLLDPEMRAEWEKGVKKAGKNPDNVPIVTEMFMFVGAKNDPELQRAASLWRFSPNSSEYVENPDPVDIQRRAEAEVPLEDVYKEWTISEDPYEHAGMIKKLFDAGVYHIYVHSAQADQKKVIEFYGKQVLPLVRDYVKQPRR
jgi:TAT-translocated FGD2 family F420-dependent dehydrogenase